MVQNKSKSVGSRLWGKRERGEGMEAGKDDACNSYNNIRNQTF